MLYLVLAILGLSIVSAAIMQSDFNSLKSEAHSEQRSTKKIVALSIIAVAAIAFVVFLAIILTTSVRPVKSTDQEAKIVGECGGYEVRYEELRYVTLMHRRALEKKYGSYGTLSADDKTAFDRELEALVTDDLKSNYVILSLCDTYKIDTDSREAGDYVQNELELFIDDVFGGSLKAYKEWLTANNLTDSFLRLMYKVDYLESALLDYVVENKLGIEYDNQNKDLFVEYVMSGEEWARTIHAYYPKESTVVDTSKSAARAKEAAAELIAVSDDEERYSLMRSTIGKAPFVSGFSVTGSGIYFTYGQMGEQYESIAFSLPPYGVSEVLETEDGYYVIMRLPLDAEDVRMNVNSLLEQYQYAVLKKYEDAQREKIEFVGNQYFDSISLSEIE